MKAQLAHEEEQIQTYGDRNADYRSDGNRDRHMDKNDAGKNEADRWQDKGGNQPMAGGEALLGPRPSLSSHFSPVLAVG